MKKKLIFFAHNLCIGGIEIALLELLRRINLSKYEVTLVLEKKEGELLQQLPTGINIIEYRVSYNKNKILRKIKNGINRLMFTLIHKNKYDFSCSYATYSITGSKLSRICSKNSCLYIHSSYEYLYRKGEYHSFFDQLQISKFKHIVFVSNEARYYFNKEYPLLTEKTLTLNNFINEDLILKKSKNEISELKKTTFLFVFVGRLTEESKQIIKLLGLMEFLKNNKMDVSCWIIGDGKDRLMLEKLTIEKKLDNIVKFMGQKSNPYPYMKQADYIILTSAYEGFPVVYNEAIILQKKIITTMDVSDDYISIPNRFGYIISHDQTKMNDEVLKILKEDSLNVEKIDFKRMNSTKYLMLEKLFDDVL